MIKSTVESNKNGSIELLRFFFAVSIVGIHLEQISDFDLFHNGHFGVEFFFLVSGILMAQSANKKLTKLQENIPESTVYFIIKKIKAIYPYLILVMVVSFFFYCLPHYGGDVVSIAEDLVNSVPDLFLCMMSGAGFDTSICPGIFWYISAMVIGLFILFPLYLKWNSASRMILFPLLGIFCLGYLQLKMGYITLTWESSGAVYYGLIRGIGEMAIGVVCYDVANFIQRLNFTTFGRAVILVFEIMCFLAIVVFINGKWYCPQSVSIFFLIAIFVTLLYSGVPFRIKCKGVISFLGKISLPLFMTHITVFNVICEWCGPDVFYGHGLDVLLLCTVVAICSFYVVSFVECHSSDFRKLLIKS